MLYIGFSSTFQDLSAANPSVDVNFYHNETGSWHLTASETFSNDEEKVVRLTGHIVLNTDDSEAKHHRRNVKSQWDYVKFKAKITKTADKVLYQVKAFKVMYTSRVMLAKRDWGCIMNLSLFSQLPGTVVDVIRQCH